ncbi:nucleoside 2-deoxyribosyltransferase [Methylocystis sp. 9N]|uniref:Nucleoside 2-deoxyribosyltransferase n=1 Tax=Methylocystis borbori TaxID=3118750 RepID=A0ABU7XI45_9HYPH
MAYVYLAGPDIFLPHAQEIGRLKKARCEHHGFVGLFPLDAELSLERGDAMSTRIFEANIALMRRSDAVIANLTPFRGPSADVGAVFEIGFAFALEKPVFAYTNHGASYRERALNCAGDGMSVENFGLLDNLMIVEAIRAQGWDIVVRDPPAERRFEDLDGFEHCLRQAAAFFRRGREGAAAP